MYMYETLSVPPHTPTTWSPQCGAFHLIPTTFLKQCGFLQIHSFQCNLMLVFGVFGAIKNNLYGIVGTPEKRNISIPSFRPIPLVDSIFYCPLWVLLCTANEWVDVLFGGKLLGCSLKSWWYDDVLRLLCRQWKFNYMFTCAQQKLAKFRVEETMRHYPCWQTLSFANNVKQTRRRVSDVTNYVSRAEGVFAGDHVLKIQLCQQAEK